MDELASLMRSYRATKFLIDRFQVVSQTYDEFTVTLKELELSRKKVDDFRVTITDLATNIYQKCKDDGEAQTAALEVEVGTLFLDNIQLKLEELIEIVKRRDNPATRSVQVKLPKMELPSFDGKYDEWLSFRDLFTAAVVNNITLTGAQRLQYLKSSLKGEAENVVRSFSITDDNFNEAWKLIEERYENKREIGYSLIKKLFYSNEVKDENPSKLQKLLDLFSESLRSLKVLGRAVQHWDDLIVFMLLQKLDGETRREWSRALKGTDFPKLQDLIEFTQSRIRSLHAATYGGQSGISAQTRRVNLVASAKPDSKCLCCRGAHPIWKCNTFVHMSVLDRISCVKKLKLCFNCFSSKHSVADCSSIHTCQKCEKKHHSLIHLEKPREQYNAVPFPRPKGDDSDGRRTPPPTNSIKFQPRGMEGGIKQQHHSTVMSLRNTHSLVKGLLATAIVWVKNSYGGKSFVRVFFDSGSDSNVIKETTVRALGIHRTQDFSNVFGVGNTFIGKSRGTTKLTIGSCHSLFQIEISCQIMSKISVPQPSHQLDKTEWKHLEGLILADPHFNQPGGIDIILGNGVFFSVLGIERRTGEPLTPIAMSTSFGWILGGDIEIPHSPCYSIRVNQAHFEAQSALRRFWELEEVPKSQVLTPLERKVEEHFTSTCRRDASGRFVTSLPLTSHIVNLGASKATALKRLLGIERRLQRKPELTKSYVDFLREYKKLGHMVPITIDEQTEVLGMTNYLPHHFVLKQEGLTTKFRVVFDGSTSTSTGLSLNSCLMVGATVQDDLFSLLCRFRLHPIALKADIVKMYRQFQVRPDDQNKLRILWRESPQLPVEEFQLTTVTYGTASAPHTATRCLMQLAEDGKQDFPVGAKVLRNDFYVDDLLSGATTCEEALQIYHELTLLLNSAGVEMRKWDSNSHVVLGKIPANCKESNMEIKSELTVSKVLGVRWDSGEDCFLISGKLLATSEVITKRLVSSHLARIFDPLGWLSPLTIVGKLILQRLWCPVLLQEDEHHLDWDEPLPALIQQEWKEYQNSMFVINSFKIPRCVIPYESIQKEFHGFCDASERAYAAVIFIRVTSATEVTCRILTSKTKVCPIKQTSLPRLELCGALLLAKLMRAVVKSTKLNCSQYFWTDSEIVLKWISSSSRRWKTFVANRVAEIHELTEAESWHYVRSEDNPADCASRGIRGMELVDHHLWWEGPPWLKNHKVASFALPNCQFSSTLLEQKPKPVLVSSVSIQVSILSKFSNFSTLVRVIAHCLRFCFNTKVPRSKRHVGTLTCEDLRKAEYACVRLAQQEKFGAELVHLNDGRKLSHSSSLLSLHPFIDLGTGLLRVGGRLQNSDLPEATKHQVILPTHHHLTKLIVEHFHRVHLHAGFQLLWATLQREFWIPRARNLIKAVLRKCKVCTRFRAVATQQLMGNFPQSRVTHSQPFRHVGVDYAGPFTLQATRGRGKIQFKSYFCLFVCFSCKAIHLEPVTDLTAESFLATLKRFVARRGLPSDVYSDCGTNFVGASKELKSLSALPNTTMVARYTAERNINWHFNAPSSPHHGGLWEAGVKSVKYHLIRVVGKNTLTLEEFLTVLCQVEAALNSRPLCALTNEPSDLNVLTPGHFLIGQPLVAVPDFDLSEKKETRLSRWQRSTQMFQHFWKRWSHEYLVQLQQRHKWKKECNNVAVGDLVLVRDEQVSPLHWRMGRIMTLHPGKDGLVRLVTLKTATGLMDRPIVKLSPLLPSEKS